MRTPPARVDAVLNLEWQQQKNISRAVKVVLPMVLAVCPQDYVSGIYGVQFWVQHVSLVIAKYVLLLVILCDMYMLLSSFHF